MKKFYIKKSPSELIQEQNRLLEVLLSKQDDKPPQSVRFEPVVASDYITASPSEAEFHYESSVDLPEDDEYTAYIPTSSIASNAQLHSVDVEKNIFENDSVKKLKQARINAKLD